MQIVIDIPEEIYKARQHWVANPKRMIDEVDIAIANGTPLPKGHGRLIDADYLREDFKTSKKISFAERMDISCIVDHTPTIIEAEVFPEDVEIQFIDPKSSCVLEEGFECQTSDQN